MANLKGQPDSFWKKKLTPKQFEVCRKGGTEAAFSGAYHVTKKTGRYYCASCGNPLFESNHQYDSGTGWPSFYQPAFSDGVTVHSDWTLGQNRMEVRCAQCEAHLGHVFDDGPAPTGKRYCINSICLTFKEAN